MVTKVVGDHIIATLDVLGYKNMILTAKPNEKSVAVKLGEFFSEFNQKIPAIAIEFNKQQQFSCLEFLPTKISFLFQQIETIEKLSDPLSYSHQEDAVKHNAISMFCLSDTLIFTYKCKSLHKKNIVDFFGFLLKKLFIDALKKGFLFRGAVSYGNVEVYNSIFAGSALIEAIAWHEQANWIGCILTKSLSNINHDQLWFRYKIPLKKDYQFTTPALVLSDKSDDEFYQLFKKYYDEQVPGLSPEVITKYQNTFDFIEYVQTHGASAHKLKIKVKK